MSVAADDSTQGEQAELAAALARYLTAQTGDRVDVEGLTRISNGWESDVYAFAAPAWRAGEHVLRLYFGGNAGPTATHEYHALDLLKRAGYPVPQVDLVEPTADALGRAFLIMERVDGRALGTLWSSPDNTMRSRALARFCELFAELHTLSWQELPGAEQVPTVTIRQQLDYWNSFLVRLPEVDFHAGIAWLYAACDAVTPQPLGLVHWDFHHENILVSERASEDDHAWVIDWTQFQATDVRFDVAWTLMLLASERDAAIADAVRAGYYAVRGWDSEAVAQEMRFFEAAAAAKRLFSVMISLTSGADSVGMRPGAEEIMRARLARFVTVYQRWLELTATPLPAVERVLAPYLQDKV